MQITAFGGYLKWEIHLQAAFIRKAATRGRV